MLFQQAVGNNTWILLTDKNNTHGFFERSNIIYRHVLRRVCMFVCQIQPIVRKLWITESWAPVAAKGYTRESSVANGGSG